MGRAEVKEINISKAKKFYDVVLRHNTGCCEPSERIIAKFADRRKAYMWALIESSDYSYDYQLIVG